MRAFCKPCKRGGSLRIAGLLDQACIEAGKCQYVSVPGNGTMHGIIKSLESKPHTLIEKANLTRSLSVLGKKLLDASGSDIETRCLCILTN